jgi:hypothetical protein
MLISSNRTPQSCSKRKLQNVALRAKVKTEMKGKTSRWVTRREAKEGSNKARRRFQLPSTEVEGIEDEPVTGRSQGGLADRIGSKRHSTGGSNWPS